MNLLHTVVNDPEKELNIRYEAFPRSYVEVIDRLIDLAKKNGSKDVIQSSRDWQTIEYIYKAFSILFPNEHAQFEKNMQELRARQLNRNSIAKQDGGMIQFQLNMPQKLYDMIITFFPKQAFDKKFVQGLAKHLPVLQVAERL